MEKMTFQDAAQCEDVRLADLISRLTLEEKCNLLTSHQAKVERLKLPENALCTEIARGKVSRDRAHPSTVFPQPLGMAAMFDPEMMEAIGEAAARETRIVSRQLARENGRSPYSGLVTLGPTVDMERHPLWGRMEECYGEDPYLCGEMAGAYTRGLRGKDPMHPTVIPGLKHFYANNNEKDRGSANARISPRLKREYYYEPFRRCLEGGGAMGVVTAYNAVNTVPMLSSLEVRNLVKGEWGGIFSMSDGGDFTGNVVEHGRYPDHAVSFAAALHAGADFMLDDPQVVRMAATEALRRGLITEQELDETVGNILRLRMRLGELDDTPGEELDERFLMCEAHTALNRQAACKQMILLKNDGILPLKDTTETLAVIGPQIHAMRMDWYCGYSAYQVSIAQGLRERWQGKVLEDEGFDIVTLRDTRTGKYGSVDGEMRLSMTAEEEDAEPFILEDWGYGSIRLRHERTGKYLRVTWEGELKAECEDTMEWFTTSALFVNRTEAGIRLKTWDARHVAADREGRLLTLPYVPGKDMCDTFQVEVLSSGLARAKALAEAADRVLVCLGNDPMLNGRETQDRPGLALPEAQSRLLEEITRVNPDTILQLVSSYPYAIGRELPLCRAVLFSSHAGPELGHAVADTLTGDNNPAGRSPLTWYPEDDVLPDIMDYDIMHNHLTYLYWERNVLFPFGFGLSYTTFRYDHLQVARHEDGIHVDVDVTNTGEMDGDEVVQVYFRALHAPVTRPRRQLCAFSRRSIRRGETVHFAFRIDLKEFRRWHPIRETYVIDEGEYALWVGPDSAQAEAEQILFLPGSEKTVWDARSPFAATAYDEAWQVETQEDELRGKSVIRAMADDNRVLYQNLDLGKAAYLEVTLVNLGTPGELTVFAEGEEIGKTKVGPVCSPEDWQKIQVAIRPCGVTGSLELRLPKDTLAASIRAMNEN